MTGIAFVGTGFVADYYMTTLANHPQLRLVGAFDRSQAQLDRFCRFYGVRLYRSRRASPTWTWRSSSISYRPEKATTPSPRARSRQAYL